MGSYSTPKCGQVRSDSAAFTYDSTMHELGLQQPSEQQRTAVRALSHRHERALGFNSGWRHEPSGVLRCHRGLELDYEFGGNPAAVFDLDPLGLGPLADFGGVQSVGLRFTSAAG